MSYDNKETNIPPENGGENSGQGSTPGAGTGTTPGSGNASASTTARGPLDEGTKKSTEKPKKTVEVNAETLEKLLKTVENQGKKIEILTEVADKNRLSRVEEMRAQGKLVKKVFLNTYQNKIIIGWKKIKDDVWIDQEGRLHEDQQVGLFFRGEKEVGATLDIRSFARLIVRVPVEVIEEGKDKEGNTNFTVQTSDGEEIKIDARFIN